MTVSSHPMAHTFSTSDLESYLDEALPPAEMARIEKAARGDPDLVRQLSAINARRDAGVYSLGEIWRRRRLSCLSREQLGSYLSGELEKEYARYATFHLEVVGCRYCQANLADLQTQRAGGEESAHGRRRKFFQSSAGYLRGKRKM
jgi:hypothetical protein